MELASSDRGAARGAVPVRRCGPRVPLARRPRAAPDRVFSGGPGDADADLRGDEDVGTPRRGARRSARRPPAASGTWRTGSSSASRPRAALGRAPRALGPRGRELGRPARRGDRHRGRGRPLRRALRGDDRGARPAATGAGRAGRVLERDSCGPLPRANVCVKVSALTPLLRPDAPERGRRDAAGRLRPLLRAAARSRRPPAHRHGVAGLPRGGARTGARAARRATSSPTARRPASCSRPTCATRPSSSPR